MTETPKQQLERLEQYQPDQVINDIAFMLEVEFEEIKP